MADGLHDTRLRLEEREQPEPSNRTRKSKGLADEPVQSQAQVEGIEHTSREEAPSPLPA